MIRNLINIFIMAAITTVIIVSSLFIIVSVTLIIILIFTSQENEFNSSIKIFNTKEIHSRSECL